MRSELGGREDSPLGIFSNLLHHFADSQAARSGVTDDEEGM